MKKPRKLKTLKTMTEAGLILPGDELELTNKEYAGKICVVLPDGNVMYEGRKMNAQEWARLAAGRPSYTMRHESTKRVSDGLTLVQIREKYIRENGLKKTPTRRPNKKKATNPRGEVTEQTYVHSTITSTTVQNMIDNSIDRLTDTFIDDITHLQRWRTGLFVAVVVLSLCLVALGTYTLFS